MARSGSGPRLVFDHADGSVSELNDAREAHAEGLARLEDLRAKIIRGDVDHETAVTELLAATTGLESNAPTMEAAFDRVGAFVSRLPVEVSEIRRKHYSTVKGGRLLPVPVNGSVRKGVRAGYWKTPLADGTFGYLQRRHNDCLQAAIATLLQRPPTTVPDLGAWRWRLERDGIDPEEIDRIVLGRLEAWLERNALTLRVLTHSAPPSPKTRWIAVADLHDPTDSADESAPGHCLLMRGRDVIFDTGWLVPPRRGEAVSRFGHDDCAIGLILE